MLMYLLFIDQPGWWTTGDHGLLHIQPETGVAIALSTGRAVVYHKIKDVIDTHTEVIEVTGGGFVCDNAILFCFPHHR